jgi:hypothetical protein
MMWDIESIKKINHFVNQVGSQPSVLPRIASVTFKNSQRCLPYDWVRKGLWQSASISPQLKSQYFGSF